MVGATLFESGSYQGRSPSLPFVLGALGEATADPRLDAVLLQLSALHALAQASQRELESLRETSARILESVRGAIGPVSVSDAPAAEATPVRTPTPVRLKLFGTFAVELDGEPVNRWPSRKARLLLACLALERGRMVPKDVLIDLFWADAPLERGSNNLSIAIHQLRTALSGGKDGPAAAIVVRQGLYGLDTAALSVDVWDFQAELAEARRALERKDDEATRTSLSRAVNLCEGSLLESDPYEEWTLEPRRSLTTAYTKALAWLAVDAQQGQDWARVGDYAGRILDRERCDEPAHRWLMTAYLRQGNRNQALQQFRVYEESLREELGVAPSEEARRLYDQILRS